MSKGDEGSTSASRLEQKKRKRQPKEVDNAPKAAESGLLFGISAKDKELDDVFSKVASLAHAAPPAKPKGLPESSSSKHKSSSGTSHLTAAVETRKEKKTKKVKHAVKEAEPKASAVSAVPAVAAEDVVLPESEDDAEELVHESLRSAPKKSKKASNQKYTPTDETPQDRDRRTVFVGNLPIAVAQSKSSLHQLRAHLLTFCPGAKIESERFRSVPFATPTTGLPEKEDEDVEKRAKREKSRAAAWRAEQDKLESTDKREQEEADATKTFIDAKGKRKVAFIKKEFHSELASCNAYVVFAHPHPDRSKNVAPILDPYEAASKVLAADGTTFLDRTIRVDSLRLPSAQGLQGTSNNLSKRDAWLPSGTDPKKSLFVGGLDYAAKEEDVRVFFEELVKAERGIAPEGGKWVTGVRIVRDSATQLGKGFGYVNFIDRESIDELLAMDQKKIKFAKRPLNIQPAKTLPVTKPSPKAVAGTSASATAKPTKTIKTASGPVPKGNPLLGEKIKDLSKDERKVVKSSDADRQARRLAKKKMKMAREAEGSKGAVKLSSGKDKYTKPKAKKGRVRSGNALQKMKGSRV